jgi:stearoyl-CoA desaturase (delta-9 desaturase)
MTNTKFHQMPILPKQPKPVVKESTFVTSTGTEEINWYHTVLLAVTPLLALYGLLFVRPAWQTLVVGVIFYYWSGIGITGGYHRLWSHRSYKASFAWRVFLLIGGSAAFQGSAKWWCRNHRAHHRYTDTDKDPYNAKRGFFYAHLGWMLVKQNTKQVGWADIADLQADPMIKFQHKYYIPVCMTVGVVLPTLICALWGDIWGGYFYACMLRMVGVHHSTFFVNSLAHWYGDKTFSDHHTAFDSIVTALLTLGEGYHNYHHEFPQDYRNGIRYFHFDPTKWIIRLMSYFGATWDLQSVSKEEIEKARVQMQQRHLDIQKAKLSGLAHYSWEDVKSKVAVGEQLVVIGGYVYDVRNFVHEHPGGRRTLLDWVGTDATGPFEGSQASNHLHSKEARSFLNAMRIAKLVA